MKTIGSIYLKMKWVFNHSAGKSVFPISLDSHGEWPGVHAAGGFMPPLPLRLTTLIQRAEDEKFSHDFLIPSNTQPPFPFSFRSIP